MNGKRSCLLSLLLLISSCVTSSPRTSYLEITERLKDRGILYLSSSNPYLSPNIYLSKVIEKSTEVKGFLEHRGVPHAIEVYEDPSKAVQMRFFYPKENELYTLEFVGGVWLIEGPTTIPKEKAEEINRSALTEKPPIVVGVNTDTNETSSKGIKKEVNLSAPPIIHPLSNTRTVGEASLDKAHRSLGNKSYDEALLKLIDATKAGLAERTDKGDLVHNVTLSGETLEIISKWYTFEEENAGKLGRLNKIDKFKPLKVGQTIIIPSYMVKNRYKLTEKGLKALNQKRG